MLKKYVETNKIENVEVTQNGSIIFGKSDYNEDTLKKFVILNNDKETLPSIIEEEIGDNKIKLSLNYEI